MKKFITTIPYQDPEKYNQRGGLIKSVYRADDNQKLVYGETAFPIIPVINGYAESGEEIEIIPILADYKNVDGNYNIFKDEVNELCTSIGVKCTFNEAVRIPYDNSIDTELDLFGKLIDCFEDRDTIYTCITFGAKPFPIILTMAMNYAHRIKKNVSIGCVVYGAMDHNTGESSIYDVTSLFYIDETVRLLAEQNVKDPAAFIKKLLK